MPEGTQSPGNGNKRLMPSNSTSVGGVGGAGLATVIVWLFGTFTHVVIPPEVAAAVGAVIANVLGYFFEGGRKL